MSSRSYVGENSTQRAAARETSYIVTIFKVEDKSIPNPTLTLTTNRTLLKVRKGGKKYANTQPDPDCVSLSARQRLYRHTLTAQTSFYI